MTVSRALVPESLGSIVEITAVLDELLRPEGYRKDIIADIATSIFVGNERLRIYDASTMHLVSIKKMLLYATPVVAPTNSSVGIPLTSQVDTPAIQLRGNEAKRVGLARGDKFRLLGVAFPNKLINHLASSVFPQKFYGQLPSKYATSTLTIDKVYGVSTKDTSIGRVYIIDPLQYENTELFNTINRLIGVKLMEEITPLLEAADMRDTKAMVLERIEPYNAQAFISKLNETMERHVDPTYTMAMYEVLNMTANQILYDHIILFGFDAPEVAERMRYLSYVKTQNRRVRQNIRDADYQRLLITRAEKLCRDKYPYFFDFTDRRSIFVRFNRFDMNKLPKQEREEISILLKKEIDAQAAILENNCEHLKHVRSLGTERTADAYKQIEQYIDFQSIQSDGMYRCKLCKYPLVCMHTVEMYDAISTLADAADSTNQIYHIRQKIINKYKMLNQKRTGLEDTEVSFTYYCKYCSGELGKSDDVIQASIKTLGESSGIEERSHAVSLIHMNIISTIGTYMNTNAISINPKIVYTVVEGEIKDEVMWMVQRANYTDEDKQDTLIRYLTSVYTCACLISININKIKSNEPALLFKKVAVGGASLKDELLTAFNILKSTTSYKQIGITDDKIKTVLIEAFKYVNKSISNDAVIFKTTSPADKLLLDVRSSPITHYAMHMYERQGRTADAVDVMGIDMNQLFPKKRTDKPISTHALYINIFDPGAKAKTDQEQYLLESYKPIVELSKLQPIGDKYISTEAPALSEFVETYQKKYSEYVKLRRATPIRHLPARNGREYDFRLKVFNIAYCATTPIRAHRWRITKANDKQIYTCDYCKLTIDKASAKSNNDIEDRLAEQRLKDACFELYTLSCPVKDAHTFDNDACSKCGITKSKIDSMDSAYYKKYEATYADHRANITESILSGAKKIILYSSPFVHAEEHAAEPKPDMIKLESVASNLNHLLNYDSMSKLGMFGDKPRALEVIQSYVCMFYAYYTFAKNVSTSVSTHHDLEFFKLVKRLFLNRTEKPHGKLTKLPQYPTHTNADQLLLDLFTTAFDIMSTGDDATRQVVEFVLKKIVAQDQRYKEFNFAKLKAMPIGKDIDLTMVADSIEVVQEDDDMDIFDGYDMDADDMEDNIDGDIDG